MRARRTCSCARGRPGPSSRSSWPRTERRATTSATRCRSPGTRSVVGARLDDTPGGADAGSAYVFVRSGTIWSEQQKLLASDGAASDHFGSSVSVSGDTVVVGAPCRRHAGRRGCGLGVRVRALGDDLDRAAEAPGVGRSGARRTSAVSVSVSGDTVVVGASGDDTPGGADAGSAYVFVRSGTTWTEQQKLLASDGAAGDHFGGSVSVSGDTVVVGAPGTTPRAAWMRARRTCSCARGRPGPSSRSSLAPDGAAGDGFGFSVSVSGDTVGGRGASSTTPRAAWMRARRTCSGRSRPTCGSPRRTARRRRCPASRSRYTITVANAGPSVASGATVTDTLPAALHGATWTCTASPGSSCTRQRLGKHQRHRRPARRAGPRPTP